ncbi:MAG: PUR family DNA/RNA-binding protein [Prevotellaceae bacterium]|jgi:antitoxin component HigA of HigAB toxin-antitoxin module|nr:PUR family DNA/RNA-binding protein [Prevotellaceae bacterium]
MEENIIPKQDTDFVFSKAVKAGKRIYYLDARRTRNTNDLYLSITESKKLLTGTPETPTFTFAKQKILLYKEDFKNFTDALHEIIEFIEQAVENEKSDNQQVRPERSFNGEKPNFRKPYVKPEFHNEPKSEIKPQPASKAEPEKPKSSFFGRLFGSDDKKTEQSEVKKTESYFDDINFDI